MTRIVRVKAGITALLLLWVMCILSLSVSAQPRPAANVTVTLEQISAARTEVEQSTSLSADQRKLATTKLDEARNWIEETTRIEAETRDLRAKLQKAPELLAQLRTSSNKVSAINAADMEQMSAEHLEGLLEERLQRFNDIQNDLKISEKELAGYVAAARTGVDDIAALKTRLEESLRNSTAFENDTKDAGLARVNRLWRDAEQKMLRARIAWLNLRQSNLDQLIELAQAKRDAHSDPATTLQEQLTQLRKAVQIKRQREAQAAEQVVRSAIADAPKGLETLRNEVTALAAEQTALVGKENAIDQRADQVSRLTEQIGRDHERVRHIVEFGGNRVQVSAMLQKRRAFGPSTKALTQEVVEYQNRLSEAVLRQIELDELLRDTADSDQHIEKLLGESLLNAGEAERTRLRVAVQETWSAYRNVISNLWKTYNRYVGKLSTVEAASRQLLQTTEAYRTFVDDHLLWMPSTELIPLTQPLLLLAGIQWLVDPEHVLRLGQDSLHALTNRAPLVVAWLASLLVLISLRPRALKVLKTAAAAVQKVRTDNFAATLAAFGHTLVLIFPLPWLFLGAGLLLGAERTAHEYTLSIAVGLQGVGQTLLLLSTLRQLCRRNGVARIHLPWHASLCDSLRTQATWLAPLAAPIAFLVSASAIGVPSAFTRLYGIVQLEEPGLLAIGRLAFVALMILMAIAVYRIWRKNGPVIQDFAASADSAKSASYHILWFLPALALPLALAIAALAGFYYTAAFLSGKVGEMLWFAIVLVLLKDLLLRGLYVTQRRLRFQEALRRREELLAQRAAAAEKDSPAETDSLPLEEEKINYAQLGEQVRRLVRMGYTIGLLVGLWWIWQDVVPAFGFLNNVELPITTSQLVDGVSKDVPLTLGDMVAGLLLGGLALFAARNIPALLELTLLQRLPLSRASRYALTTMTQYVVAMIGLVITFKALGLQWSSIQWLVAALSVGLGFGLQEIVANFVSGIILLFEQPIRVGDVVTVENTTGTVSRIRIRATTIVNWDRQELVIPNKSFITGQLINWTLSDTINRVIITIGVAYGSDTRKAMELIREAATERPAVLTDPPPKVTFEAFGDNSLSLLLRVYLDDVDDRLETITELHQAISDKFEAAGIVIAFPQRDIHLDTERPLELVLRRDVSGPEIPPN